MSKAKPKEPLVPTIARRHINPRRNGRADVLMFGESAGTDEAEAKKAFVGKSWKEVLRPVIEYELAGKWVILDNVVPLWLGRNIKPDLDLRNKWKPYVREVIEKYRPKVVLLLGEHALRSFGWTVKPTYNCGRVEVRNGNTIVMSAHPAYFLRSPQNIGLFRKAIESVKACLRKRAAASERVDSLQGLRERLGDLRKVETGFDLETSSLRPHEGHLLTAAFAPVKERPFWIPLYHSESPNGAGTTAKVVEAMCSWWSRGPRIVHNAKFELSWMRANGAKDPRELWDTMILARFISENEPAKLSRLVVSVLGRKPYWVEVEGYESKAEVPLDVLGEYNAQDAICCRDLKPILLKRVSEAQLNAYHQIIAPTTNLLVSKEERGIEVDQEELTKLGRSTARKIAIQEKKVKESWPKLNVRSPKQMGELLYDEMGLEPPELTKKGSPSASKDCLDILLKENPELAPIRELRTLLSLQSRIIHPWQQMSATDGRIHSQFGYVRTWRLSSSDPNMQNTSREGPERKCLVSRHKGGYLVQGDYRHHELRIYAAVAGDEILLETFARDEDPHGRTALDLTKAGVPTDRPTGKNINFAVTFDITPWGFTLGWLLTIEGKKNSSEPKASLRTSSDSDGTWRA
jgi:uracil-DNA glycosylase family 4